MQQANPRIPPGPMALSTREHLLLVRLVRWLNLAPRLPAWREPDCLQQKVLAGGTAKPPTPGYKSADLQCHSSFYSHLEADSTRRAAAGASSSVSISSSH